ncbi:porin [Burkholderia ubonensis]|uniref:porin n=1 Tax=Burkholderia ubonensis TaxID=101571 RepID=UPI00075B0242|nr:porin [Burkholderia ubonensis]KVG23664.1 porin [Burkholderia ubonensis]OJA66964.1 porin [Burkholderia ubonensis]
MLRQICGVVALYACAAHAQSSVTLYGVIDDGLTYVSNVGGSHVYKLDDGVSQGSRFGLKGNEDLGGGWKSLFALESGFNPNTGALRQGGLMFGRLAYVGVSSTSFGTLTFGRQYDQMTTTLLKFHSGITTTGIYSLNPGDQDRISGEWLDNMITYASPEFAGVKFNAQYSFNSQSSPTTNYGHAYSLSVSYAHGPFSFGAATTDIHDYFFSPGSSLGVSSFFGHALALPSTNVTMREFRTAGLGAGWDFGKVYLSGVYSNTRFDNGVSAETLQSLNAAARYTLAPNLLAGAGYTYSKLGGNKWNEVGLTLDYLLSKRTDVYASANYEKASGGAKAALVTIGPSGNDKQLAVRVGMRHRF